VPWRFSAAGPRSAIEDRGLVDAYIARVEVRLDRLIVELNQTEATDGSQPESTSTLRIPWTKAPPTRRRELLLPAGLPPQHARPIRSDTKGTLIAAIAQGRRWLKELIDDRAATTDSIAKRAACSVRKVNMTISLAFLAPDLVRAAIEGRLPHGLGITRLSDLPAEWTRQHQILGIVAQ
jgi:site-specific DNA recombinase